MDYSCPKERGVPLGNGEYAFEVKGNRHDFGIRCLRFFISPSELSELWEQIKGLLTIPHFKVHRPYFRLHFVPRPAIHHHVVSHFQQ